MLGGLRGKGGDVNYVGFRMKKLKKTTRSNNLIINELKCISFFRFVYLPLATLESDHFFEYANDFIGQLPHDNILVGEYIVPHPKGVPYMLVLLYRLGPTGKEMAGAGMRLCD